MKAMSKKLLAIGLAVVTVFSMSSVTTVTANAATKSNVTVKYSNKKVKTASVSKVSVSVDGQKAAKNVTVYLTGTKKVNVKTAVTVNVKGKKSQKIKNVAKVKYSSSNKKVATVSTKGVITVKKAGKAVITVKSSAKGNKTAKINLKAVKGVKSMSLSTSKVSVTEGEAATVTATVKAVAKVKTTVTAKSDDTSVVTASVVAGKNGVSTVKLTAVKAGTATVTVAPKYGSAKAKTIKVTVNAKPVAPVAEKEFTKVVFTNKGDNEVTVKGSVKVSGVKSVEAIEKVLAAVGGDYSVTVAGKTVDVKAGKATQDLSKLVNKTAEKTDVTIVSTKKISDVLALVEAMKLAEDVKIEGNFSVVDEKIGAITDISVAKSGDVKFTFGKTAYTAFVKGGELYLEGNQVATLKAITTITSNNAIVKDFVLVKSVR